MVFTSSIFLFLFFPLTVTAYILAGKSNKNIVLLISSILFYSFWRVDHTLILILSVFVDFYCGNKIYTSIARRKKMFLCVSLISNLGILFYFKYSYFVGLNLNLMFNWLSIPSLSIEEIALPLGISFFTFQTMSYSIDIYRCKISPAKDIMSFATYVVMFPQLIAGPIVRYSNISEDLNKERIIRFDLFLHYFCLGFMKKVFIANNLATQIDYIFSNGGGDIITASLGAIGYSIQLYFDFSGYSDMAIGLGYLFGFRFPLNFNSPYKALSITDFWRRWHISLSTWFRDYLYIPLGGNRGSKFTTVRNLIIVMFLCALWHGASYNFLVWGIGHAVLLISEKYFLSNILSKIPSLCARAYTLFFVFTLWIPFNSSNYLKYFDSFVNLKSVENSLIYNSVNVNFMMALLGGTFAALFCKNTHNLEGKISQERLWLILIGFILATIEMLGQAYSPFLYFNF